MAGEGRWQRLASFELNGIRKYLVSVHFRMFQFEMKTFPSDHVGTNISDEGNVDVKGGRKFSINFRGVGCGFCFFGNEDMTVHFAVLFR